MANDISTDEIGILLAAIDKMDCALVEVSVGDVRIVVRCGGETAGAVPAVAAPVFAARATPAAAVSAVPATAVTNAAPDLARWLELEAAGKVRLVRAPIIGTFYRAKGPGEPPFVEVGTVVQAGATLGLMEVMKLFNSLSAEVGGTVVAILAANGAMVEFDQPVFAIEPG